MNRRGFLAGILAAGVAPAIVRADSLMRIIPRETTLLTAPQDVLAFVDGDVIAEYIRAEGTMVAETLTNASYFTVPEGVSSVWLTMIGMNAHAGGGGRWGKMVSPYEDADGNMYQKPVMVHPGQRFTIKRIK